jgi:hypothetical protein
MAKYARALVEKGYILTLYNIGEIMVNTMSENPC